MFILSVTLKKEISRSKVKILEKVFTLFFRIIRFFYDNLFKNDNVYISSNFLN